jgi:lipid-binding SYLF domain-containing protein
MLRRDLLARTAVVTAGLALAPVLGAGTALAQLTEQQDVINGAQTTLAHLRTDKEFGNARNLMRTARAVLIIPQIVKAGLFFGGEGGNGVLLVRSGKSWSEPAFYTLGSASFGLQAGVQVSEMIVIIRTDRALRAVMQDNFKVGATADLTIVTLGSSAEAASNTGGLADIIVWASSSGVYAGLSINGSVISSRDAYNQAYYGRPVKASNIVLRHAVRNPGAEGLRRSLSAIA